MSQSHHNIALLLCDDIDAADQARFGSYQQMFEAGFAAVDTDNNPRIHLSPIPCYTGEPLPAPADFAGYIISGSRYSVYDELPWLPPLCELVRGCWAAKRKMLGICFGHQLLAHALGGRVEKNQAGWGFGIHHSHLSTRPHWLRDTDTDTDAAPDGYRLVVIHQDQVCEPPPMFTTIAHSDFCPHSMLLAGEHLLGLQGHPEFSQAFCRHRADCREGRIGEATYAAALHSLQANDTDSPRVFQWLHHFLLST